MSDGPKPDPRLRSKRSAKRAACTMAARIVENAIENWDRGIDYTEADYSRLNAAIVELIAELDRRGDNGRP